MTALITNTNSGVPYLAKFQVLDPKGSFNNYDSEDPKLTELIAEASALPVDKADEAWKKVYDYVVDIAWFVPVSATHVVYFATPDIDAPKPGQSSVVVCGVSARAGGPFHRASLIGRIPLHEPDAIPISDNRPPPWK